MQDESSMQVDPTQSESKIESGVAHAHVDAITIDHEAEDAVPATTNDDLVLGGSIDKPAFALLTGRYEVGAYRYIFEITLKTSDQRTNSTLS